MQGEVDPAQELPLGIQDEIAGGRPSVRDHHHARMMLTTRIWLRPISEQRTDAQMLGPADGEGEGAPPCQPFTRYPVLLWCQAEVDPDLTEPEWTNGS